MFQYAECVVSGDSMSVGKPFSLEDYRHSIALDLVPNSGGHSKSYNSSFPYCKEFMKPLFHKNPLHVVQIPLMTCAPYAALHQLTMIQRSGYVYFS